MIMNEEDKADFETSTNCWICRKDFEEGELRVRDHCHFTGKYRGAAHQKCNALFRKPNFVPVFFHNLSGYCNGAQRLMSHPCSMAPSCVHAVTSFLICAAL